MNWRRLGTELYCARNLTDDPLEVLHAWKRLLPTGTTFAGATAAWLFGLDLDPLNPAEVSVPPDSGVRSRSGLSARRCELTPDEVAKVRGLPATTLHRTLLDLCSWRPKVEALVAVDMAFRAGLTDTVTLWSYSRSMPSRAGSARLRELARIGEPAESPMETRLRWLLLQGDLPRPQVQADLRDDAGRFLGRADLLYPAARLVIEFDGGNHRERLVSDDRRQNLLMNAGYRVLRFTTLDVKGRPDIVAAQVHAALGANARIQTRGKTSNEASEWIQARGIAGPVA
jgi:very-short-patch-repair endonuclease